MPANPNKTHTRTMSQTDVDMVKDWLDSGASANALTQVYGVSRLIITQIGAGQVTVGVGPNIGPQPMQFSSFVYNAGPWYSRGVPCGLKNEHYLNCRSIDSIFVASSMHPIDLMTEERLIRLQDGSIVTADHAALHFRDLLYAQRAKILFWHNVDGEWTPSLRLPIPRREMFATDALWEGDRGHMSTRTLMDKLLQVAGRCILGT